MTGPDAPSEEIVRTETTLIASSRKWINDALKAWAEDDYARVAVLAPLAVEHLGKAVLWSVNPVLLVPLTQDNEHSLLSLAGKPDIADPRLRTIGLSILLRRLEQVTGEILLDKKRRETVVAVRNGAMHVGAPVQSRQVLLDCLSLIKSFLSQLGVDSESFYGDHFWSVEGLLDEKRTEVGHKVAAKRAGARLRLNELEERLGTEAFEETAKGLEGRAYEALDPTDFGLNLYGIDKACPECGSVGRLFGRVDVEGEPDWDVEPLGGGKYETYMVGVEWKVTFYPQAFACNVCRLILNGAEELTDCGLPAAAEEIELEELGEDFDPDVDG